MLDSYELFGCINFRTDSYAISIPLLKKQAANYFYVPKTDNFFNIIDFYEVLDVEYEFIEFPVADKRMVELGQKTPVPIIENDQVLLIDPTWSADEIRQNYPKIETETLKAFISLRARLAEISAVDSQLLIEHDIDELLEKPVRSKYWISKFRALISAAHESGQPSENLSNKIEEARLLWLEKFATKSSLGLVLGVLDTPHLQIDADKRLSMLVRRFERILLEKGLHLPRADLNAVGDLFPDGLLKAIERDSADQFQRWDRLSAISRFVAQQVFHRFTSTHMSEEEIHNPSQWTVSELKLYLRFYRIIASDDYWLDDSSKYFSQLFHESLGLIEIISMYKYQFVNMIMDGHITNGSQEVMELLGRLDIRGPHSNDYWLHVLRDILIEYEKLFVVSKIVRPSTRKHPNKEIAFDAVDHNFMDTIKRAYQSKNIGLLRTIVAPSGTTT